MIFFVALFKEPLTKLLPDIIRIRLGMPPAIPPLPSPQEPQKPAQYICTPPEFWRDGEVKDMCALQMPYDDLAYCNLILETVEACRKNRRRLTFNLIDVEAISKMSLSGWRLALKDIREKNLVCLHFVFPREREGLLDELHKMLVDSLAANPSPFIKIRTDERV